MPFKKGRSGNLNGRPKGSKGAQTKAWLLEKMHRILDSECLEKELIALKKKSLRDYLRLMISLLPKEQKFEMDTNPFGNRATEELNHFIAHGKWPEDSIESSQDPANRFMNK